MKIMMFQMVKMKFEITRFQNGKMKSKLENLSMNELSCPLSRKFYGKTTS